MDQPVANSVPNTKPQNLSSRMPARLREHLTSAAASSFQRVRTEVLGIFNWCSALERHIGLTAGPSLHLPSVATNQRERILHLFTTHADERVARLSV